MKKSKIEITPNQVNEVNDFLQKLPKVTLTAEDAIYKWAPAIIKKIEEDGYTYSLICEILKREKQIDIAVSTLSTYINKFKRQQKVNLNNESNEESVENQA